MGMFSTTSGKNVSPDSALRIAAVMSAIRLVSDTVASLPLEVRQRISDDETRAAREHPLYPILHDSVGPSRTSPEWRATSQAWLEMFGNAYSVILRDGAGKIKALVPWHPSSVRVENDSTRGIIYTLMSTKGEIVKSENDVLHLRGLTLDAEQILGLSPIRYAKETFGAALAAEEHGATLFGRGSVPGGVIEADEEIPSEAKEAMVKAWQQANGGSARANGMVVMDFGAKYKPIFIPNSDSQWIEFRKFSVAEVARTFRVPPHMIGDVERATDNNVEKQSLEFLSYSMLPRLVRWEKSLEMQLLSPQERAAGYYIQFNVNALLRVDTKTQMEAFALGRQWGWWSVNDVRKMLGENPVEGGDGRMQPLNMIGLGESVLDIQGLQSPQAARAAHIRPFLSEISQRLVRAECREIRKCLNTSRWPDNPVSPDEIRTQSVGLVQSLVRDIFHNGGGAVFAESHADRTTEQIREALAASDGWAAVDSLLVGWEQSRPDQIAAALAAAMLKE
ncbi:hypothetical protein LCGC14_0972280 [marine sediment metagenome]|uniref:Phage portal protein n=1 Tax=marine sediment metagenome TaxID=412755 RepID=A0A0F9RHR4_9ZZZZ